MQHTCSGPQKAHTHMLSDTHSMHLQTGMGIISTNHKLSTAGMNQGRCHGNRPAIKPQEAAMQTCDLCGNPLITIDYGALSDPSEIYTQCSDKSK